MKRRSLPFNPARGLIYLLSALFLAILVLPISTMGQVYPPNFKFIKVPNPLSGDNPIYPLIARTVPAPGQSFTDSRFSTVQTRITQSSTLRHEYSRFDPFNCQRTLLLLLDSSTSEWRVYRTQSLPYDQPANLVRTINNLAELRWDPQDSDILWGFRDFSIIKLNVETGAETLVKDFAADPVISPILLANPLIYHVTCMNEGESSRDKRFWALALQNGDDPAHPEWSYIYKYLFTWDRLQNQVLGTYPLSLAQGQRLDWVGMSTLGNWVLIAGESEAGVPPNWGLLMASKDFSVLHELHQNTGHADVGLDSRGREVIVMQNAQTDYVDLIPLDLQAKPVNSPADYNNNVIKPLVFLYYNSESPISMNSTGIHISCNYSGYALVSTYIQPNLTDRNWLDRCFILVRLDPNKVRAVYLAKTYNTTQQYWEETHGTISNDGSRIVWVDNWGQSVTEPQMPQLTLTQLDMPPHWQNQFTPPMPPVLSLLLGD
ncbi:MAG: hypothetical protein L6277_11660 [Desulfobacterales bacterium]|nr:hypothetical protein [Pseudomonadota bacterium]MCG2772729.1 hypothetical protein [Desulfobacterales bacterium]